MFRICQCINDILVFLRQKAPVVISVVPILAISRFDLKRPSSISQCGTTHNIKVLRFFELNVRIYMILMIVSKSFRTKGNTFSFFV